MVGYENTDAVVGVCEDVIDQDAIGEYELSDLKSFLNPIMFLSCLVNFHERWYDN